MREHEKTARKKLLDECNILRNRLQECHINLTTGDEHDLVVDSSSLANALDLLTTSDDHIGLLLAEVPFMFLRYFCLSHFIFHVFSILTRVQRFVFCDGNLEILNSLSPPFEREKRVKNFKISSVNIEFEHSCQRARAQ